MYEYIENRNLQKDIEVPKSFPENFEDYSELLKFYELDYKSNDCYLQVGEITNVQGWILHLSIIISQCENLLKTVIPLLLIEKVPFKVPINKDVCRNLLNGNFGVFKLGKIISIYPETEFKALALAKNIIKITHSFKGPFIPTDIQLENIVHTRYGSFNPIIKTDITGKEERYIYDQSGNLIKDSYTIPFTLIKGMSWPFTELAMPVSVKSKQILKKTYKLTAVLKEDIKGFVYKGLYLKRFFKVSYCVIKQGRKNLSSDDAGRDVSDRLIWQEELHKDLSDYIPIPRIIDVFQEEDKNTYLVMEFIDGKSLHSRRKKMNSSSRSWLSMEKTEQLKFLNYLNTICSIIEKLHQKGYVHRDIAPGNFLIDKKDNIYLIDLELAYSFRKRKPIPPFTYGTSGFMSPEQQDVLEPTIKEDIYGIGALMLFIFTGLNPSKFDKSNIDIFLASLNFFIPNESITKLISDCLCPNPQHRPDLLIIKREINKYKANLQENKQPNYVTHGYNEACGARINTIISSAINGLISSPTIFADGLWYSKFKSDENYDSIDYKSYAKYPGLYEGVGGILYSLARVKKAGFNINHIQKAYFTGWEYIENEYLYHLPKNFPGLYDGSAGIALALAEGLNTNLLSGKPIYTSRIKVCLEIPATDLNLASGIAGQGIVALQCRDYLVQQDFKQILNLCVNTLLEYQLKDGSWPINIQSDKKINILSFGYGNPGIIFFLLDYISYYPNERVQKATLAGLNWLLQITNNLESLKNSNLFNKIIPPNNNNNDERKGIILTFIKAYTTLGINHYKKISEEILIEYPANIAKNDFSQHSGLAALGELYIEAFQAFQNDEWKKRANWIASTFTHTFIKTSEESGFWQLDDNNPPTADLMTGASGIIHFLARFMEPHKIGYRLLK